MLGDFKLQSSLYSRRVRVSISEISVEYPADHAIHMYLKSQHIGMMEYWVRILECGSGNLDSGYPPGRIPE
jgi:hypothetical protein